jgi:hypothetical protein
MAAYTLKNGLVIADVRFSPPKPNASPSARFVPHTLAGRSPVLRFTTSTDVDENGQALSPGYAISAIAKTQGFSIQQMNDNDVRFMQLVTIKNFSVEFAGRKSADGMLSYSFRGGLTNILLDCLTNSAANAAVNFPFYNAAATSRLKTDYFAIMSDTPGFVSNTDERNSKTDRWNYLWRFRSEAEFITYLVFVNKDGTREPLEGWSWTLQRLIILRWRGGQPQIYNQMSFLKPAPQKTVLVVGDIRRAILLNPSGIDIANVLGNNAQQNFRTAIADVSFMEQQDYSAEVDPLFWV